MAKSAKSAKATDTTKPKQQNKAKTKGQDKGPQQGQEEKSIACAIDESVRPEN